MTASWASSPAVRAVMRANRSRDTGPELALRRELRRLGQRGYRVNWRLPVARRTADVAWPGLRLAVFVDGCWWHGCPDHRRVPRSNATYWDAKVAANRERDLATDEQLRARGWLSVRLWAHTPPPAAAEAVAWMVELLRAGGGYNRAMAGEGRRGQA